MKVLDLIKFTFIVVVLIINPIFYCTSSAFEITRPENSADREITSAKTFDQKIAAAKRYLKNDNSEEKLSAIEKLGRMGGEAVPVLLDQLKVELNKPKEIAVLGGKDQLEESRYIGDIISALGHTRDRRTIDPLIDIVKSDSPSRWRAIGVLGVVGSDEGQSLVTTYMFQAKPTTGFEVGEKDREKIKNILIAELSDKDESIRMEAVSGLRLIGATDTIELLKSISENDPYSTEKIDEKGKKVKGVKVYPVRDEAKRALEELGSMVSD